MNKEFLYIGGSCLLAPLVACMIALPLLFTTKNVILAIILGTTIGMGVYVGACILARRHAQTSSVEDSSQSASRIKKAPDNHKV